ncbi:succinate dehydrogenase cytochrome b small subunit [Cordyceps militaris CM01]|uniref:Succinate dehydrogenase [ubiquinone] cytochrome b small subunit n=1 Tax=Cordyceps militaris (strain CM01) TaxID=983644 RepID=G3J772_CORMM|nr:succinate dehydrogenase cytochrome b small subunit [Cordyceps militaris CM01]EGX95445.1 succinate dehydrogenase cytochrome b small subunit [Cordyceps militaris CM01]
MASIMRPSILRQAAISRSVFSQPAMRNTVLRAAPLHTTTKRLAILPPGPQVIHGTDALDYTLTQRSLVNDPAPVPHANAAHGSYHWAFERLLAASLVPLSIAPFASGSLNPTLDAILCSALLLHSHIGFQSVIIDYIPKRTWGSLHKSFMWALNIATVAVGVSLYEFETNDVGVTEAIKRVWKASSKSE